MSHFRNQFLALLVVFCHVTGLSLVSCVPSIDPDYDKRVRPNEGLSQDKVEVGLFINSIRSVSEADMTAVLDVFLQVFRTQIFQSNSHFPAGWRIYQVFLKCFRMSPFPSPPTHKFQFFNLYSYFTCIMDECVDLLCKV